MISIDKESMSHINSSIPSLPKGWAGLSGTQIPNGDLLVCGGWTGSVASNQYLYYKKGSNQWTKVGTMLMYKCDHSSVWIDGRLLTTGGRLSWSLHHEEFTFLDGVKEMKEMPVGLYGHTATIFDQHKIIVCGGHYGEVSNIFFKFRF